MNDWHADPESLARYAAGSLAGPRAASVEAHLLACAHCRGELAGRADTQRLAAVWGGVIDLVDRPTPGLVERLLQLLGVRGDVARLLAATPSLRLSWLAGLVVTLAFAVLAAHEGPGRLGLFLVMAPLLPLVGVAAAFGPVTDPAHELVAASPMGAFHLFLLRAMAVVGATVALTGAATLALPHHGLAATTWLLPALALTVGSVALATYIPPLKAAVTLATLWVGGVIAGLGMAPAGRSLAGATERFVAFQPEGQLVFLVLAVAATCVVARRQFVFDLRSQP